MWQSLPNEIMLKSARWARAVCTMLVAACAACGDGRPVPAAARSLAAALRRSVAESTAGAVKFDSAPSLRELLLSGAHVGHRVRVVGRCRTRPAALDRPARPNQWQLEAEGVAIFVIGAVPSDCSPPGNHAMLMVTALVAEDTLPAIGDLPPAPRRYLILINAEAQ